MVEYHPWGPSRRFRGEVVAPPFRPIRLPYEAEKALDADPAAPSFLGSASKHFDDVLQQLFYGYSGKLLSPDDARATAAWVARWGGEPGRDPELAARCRDFAARLEAAAGHGWYLNWER